MNSNETSNSFIWPKIFSQKENILSRFKRYNIDALGLRDNQILPTIQYLKNGNYAIWNGGPSFTQSAWNDSIQLSDPDAGWVNPKEINDNDLKTFIWQKSTPEFKGFMCWEEYQKSDIKSNPKTVRMQGSYAGFHTWWSHNYGHILHDALPYLLWFKKQIPEYCKILLLKDPIAQEIIQNLDINLYHRITWLDFGEIADIEGELFVSSPLRHPLIRVQEFQPYLKDWLLENYSGSSAKDVIYHTRHGTTNRRLLDENHEKEIIKKIKSLMKKHNLKGDLKIFSGQDKEGQTLSIEEQINIFKNAHTIIGPHSSGLINILHSNLDKVKLLEFIPSEECAEVQAAFNSYYNVIPSIGIDYNILLYTDNSVSARTFIDTKELEIALNNMWGN